MHKCIELYYVALRFLIIKLQEHCGLYDMHTGASVLGA